MNADNRYFTDLQLNSRQIDHECMSRQGVDLSTSRRDLNLVSGKQNVAQAIINRLLTRQGELGELGYPEYGSRLFKLIGELYNRRTRGLLELYIRECLDQEPRVQQIMQLHIPEPVSTQDQRSLIEVDLTLQLTGENDWLQITLPVEI